MKLSVTLFLGAVFSSGEAFLGGFRTNTFSGLGLAQQNPTRGKVCRPALKDVVSAAPTSTSTTTTTTTTNTTIMKDDADFIKPDPDKRKYRAIRLENGLECLLVSSPESDVEAGAVHVKAGHMDDPDDRPGLAHFHEHMLFLGTEKYPDENEYEAFLNVHGGSTNAFTDMEDTNYYFSVTPYQEEDEEADVDIATETTSEALEGSLDRLAQFFIAPRFDRGMVDRELRAIDSEYRNSITSDAWRNYQLLKSLANQQHPFSKFGCGCYGTLTQGGKIINTTHAEPGQSSPVDDLLNFWNTFYRTYNMKLCVVGRSSLDALQGSIERTFGQLPASEGTPRHQNTKSSQAGVFSFEHAQYEEGVAAFGNEQLGKIRHVIPLLESRVIKIYFATPPLDDPILRQSRPHRVLSHLLGHESPGSLHAVLNDKGFITGLSSGVGIDSSDFSLFSLAISLTPEGMKQKDQVLDLTFQWISLIRQTVDDTDQMKAYHEEIRQIGEMGFRFRENGDPTNFCSSAAEQMFSFSPEKILRGSSETGDYDEAVAKIFLERIRPENCFITVINSDLEDDGSFLRERWYGATYKEMDMTEEQIERWTSSENVDSSLHLPALNDFLPTDFSLRCDDEGRQVVASGSDAEPPKVLIDLPELRLWHKMDSKWRVPKAFIQVSLLSPNVYRSPRTMTYNRIFERILNDDLNSFVYDASLAGCTYRVSCRPTGFRLAVRGYSEKLSFLFEKVTSRIFSLIEELEEGPAARPELALKFLKAKANLLRETKNYRLDPPYDVAAYNLRLMLEESVWFVQDYIAEMEGEFEETNPVTMQGCAETAKECFSGRVKAEASCYGNIDEASAHKVAEVINKRFLNPTRTLQDIEAPIYRAMKMPTVQEAVAIFGPEVNRPVPLVYQELAFSPSEENNAIELHFQVGCESSLGYRGVAIFDLISHLAYNSAYNQLRTKEQLGYIVSAYAKKATGGSWGLSVVVQSSVVSPTVLEERAFAWLKLFRTELEAMSPDSIASEAGAVVAQLLERDTKLSQEVNRMWGEILQTQGLPGSMKSPPFDRLDRLAKELTVTGSEANALKEELLVFFDRFLAFESPERRTLSSRVYNRDGTDEFNANRGQPGIVSSYDEILFVKQFLSTWPLAPYWCSHNQAR